MLYLDVFGDIRPGKKQPEYKYPLQPENVAKNRCRADIKNQMDDCQTCQKAETDQKAAGNVFKREALALPEFGNY